MSAMCVRVCVLSGLALALAACAAPAMVREIDLATPEAIGQEPVLVRVLPGHAVTASGSVDLGRTNSAERSAAAYEALTRAQDFVRTHGIALAAPPIVVNRTVTRERWDFDVMLPVRPGGLRFEPANGVSLQAMPSGLAFAADHLGSIDSLQRSYERLAREAPPGVRLLDLTWEQYLTDPSETPPERQRTRVFRLVEDAAGGSGE